MFESELKMPVNALRLYNFISYYNIFQKEQLLKIAIRNFFGNRKNFYVSITTDMKNTLFIIIFIK